MKRHFGITLALALAAGMILPQVARAQESRQSGEMWLHVRVEKSGEDGESVRVNVPLSLAAAVIPAIDAHQFNRGKIRIGRHTNDIDLRALLAAVQDAADGEFVTIDKKNETIRVTKSGGFLLVKTEETGEESSVQVNVKVPLVVVEAMLSAGEDEIDLAAAIKALREFGDIDLVEVRDGDETVRVWIDSNSSGE